METNDLTLFINSCDLYADAWELFFTLFHKYSGKLQTYPIVLATEKKKYSFQGLNIETITSGKQNSWSKRMLRTFSHISSEYILFTLEDYFLLSEFNYEEFIKILSFMKSEKSIGYIGLSSRKDLMLNGGYLSELDLEKQRMNMTVSLWRKSFFVEILRKHESIWDFERYAHIRASKYGYKGYSCNVSAPVIYAYSQPSSVQNGRSAIGEGYGIIRGKWFKDTIKLCEEYGVKVNFANLGFFEPQEIADNEKQETKTYQFLLQKIINRINKYKRRWGKWRESRKLDKSLR